MEKKTQEKKKKRKVNSQVLLNTQLLTYKQGRMYFFMENNHSTLNRHNVTKHYYKAHL